MSGPGLQKMTCCPIDFIVLHFWSRLGTVHRLFIILTLLGSHGHYNLTGNVSFVQMKMSLNLSCNRLDASRPFKDPGNFTLILYIPQSWSIIIKWIKQNNRWCLHHFFSIFVLINLVALFHTIKVWIDACRCHSDPDWPIFVFGCFALP